MTFRNRIRAAKLFPVNACTAGILAVFICASVTWPLQEFAQQPSPAPAAGQAAAASLPSLFRTASPATAQSSESKLDLQTFAFNWRPSAAIAGLSESGRGAITASIPAFNVPKLADSPGGENAVASAPSEGRHIRKGYLALGILGVGGVVAGAVALSMAGGVHCKSTSVACSDVRGDVHTAGEVMIPAGAAVAALGFIFAFRHK